VINYAGDIVVHQNNGITYDKTGNIASIRLNQNLRLLDQWRQSGLKSGGRGSGSNKFQCFKANFQKISIFQGKFSKSFDFFPGNFTKNFDFPGKNVPFIATSGQIILFLFKSHHFRTYVLCVIRYRA